MSAELAFWLVVSGVALLASVVSGVLGMAGGMLLLVALLWKLEPVEAIPIHGFVQLASNASRAWWLRRHIRWRAVWRFAWPLVPAGGVGLWLLQGVPEAVGRVSIGAFVLLAIWLPRLSRMKIEPERAERVLPVGGLMVGLLSTFVGATGPLLGPFVLALELGAQGTVATLAGCQILQHASKVLVFGMGGFELFAYVVPIAALSAAAVLGSALGTRLLDRVPERGFAFTVRLVLTGLSLHLLGTGVVSLLS